MNMFNDEEWTTRDCLGDTLENDPKGYRYTYADIIESKSEFVPAE